MDDVFIPCPKAISISTFQDLLNNLDVNIHFTIEPAVYFHDADNEYQNYIFYI